MTSSPKVVRNDGLLLQGIRRCLHRFTQSFTTLERYFDVKAPVGVVVRVDVRVDVRVVVRVVQPREHTTIDSVSVTV